MSNEISGVTAHPSWFAIIVIIIGWFINNWLANRRETRKELREYLNQIGDIVEELKKCLLEYHTSEKRNLELEGKIKSIITRLAMRSSLLKFVNREKLAKMIYDLRTSITMKNFESSRGFRQHKVEDPLLHMMIAKCDGLVASLENDYVASYHQMLSHKIGQR